jgi:tetratricopeptide (TPR) repeat protein
VEAALSDDDTPPVEAPRPLAAASDDDSFDLAAELAGAFEDANAPDAPAAEAADETDEVLSKVDDGFESIFSDFKKGVSAALEEGDYETRYDLGIAYREMGLYEDAIAEFRVCLDSANRRLESLHMMGLSAYDLGRYADAVHNLEQALSTPELAENRKVGIYFDLGRAHEASGDLGRAEGVYCEVEALDSSFPGLQARLESVRSGGQGEPLQLSSEGEFESFRDLFSDENEDSQASDESADEVFESFDDVITDVEAEFEPKGAADAELEVDAVFEIEPEVETPDPDDDLPTDPGASGRRKKKISFV